ncbi:MAG TPA: SAM-dependent methyltransferase [Candidatus Sulfotelmatobacter sp.]|nr:SAM-dependent methyltransferase [Candidatus Sulfotelmatobacter sp.]
MSAPEFTVRQIGVVKSKIKTPADDCWANLVSEIELDSSQFSAESTRGLDEFSHVEIVFVLDRVALEKVFTVSRRPRDRADFPLVGIFAQRAKDRPNRIGVTTCKIERIDGLHIFVREFDAIDGTPILDVKPYIAEFGPREPVRQPAWSKDVMSNYFRPKP